MPAESSPRNPQAIKAIEEVTKSTNAQPDTRRLMFEATSSAAITPAIAPYHWSIFSTGLILTALNVIIDWLERAAV